MNYDDFINRQTWVFAKTMANIPHWYIVRDRLSADDQAIFKDFVQYIRDNGICAQFWKYNFPYLEYDGFYYWTMGDPVEQTTVINRASKETNEIKDGIMYINGIPQTNQPRGPVL